MPYMHADKNEGELMVDYKYNYLLWLPTFLWLTVDAGISKSTQEELAQIKELGLGTSSTFLT